MNKKECREWIEALRSGNYKQTKFTLATQEGFCCLGVKADLDGKLTKVTASDLKKFDKDINPDNVPVKRLKAQPGKSLEWNSFSTYQFCNILSDTGAPTDTASLTEFRKKYGARSLAVLNDEGKTFDEIADIIEEFILPRCTN